MAQGAGAWSESECSLIRDQLARICANPLFAQAARRRRLLQFIVTQTLSSHPDRLKGYTLGVEVFDRDPSFDPAIDPIVRVEAAQLRSKLREYYAGDGQADLVAIDLPKGAYAPLIRFRAPEPVVAASRRPAPAPGKPSLAVLPFANVSDDPAQGYFADGLTDDLITDLSKLSGLFVISRHSAFVYKGVSKRAEEIAQELGVRYLLEGSVRRAAGRVRITAQLVDAETGDHLWAERYDRDASDVFAVQDDTSRSIVRALQVRLSGLEVDRLGHEGTRSIEAHDSLLQGLEWFWRYTREGNAEAQSLFRRAVELDPDYAAAHAWLARSYVFPWTLGFVNSVEESLEPALAHAQRAVELDDFLPFSHAILGWVEVWRGKSDRAIAEGRRACALDPNNADAHVFLSFSLATAGHGDEALLYIEKAMRLNPHPSTLYLMALGQCHFVLEDYELAISAFRKGVEINPVFIPNHAFLAATYGLLGRLDEARAEADIARGIWPSVLPHFSLLGERFERGMRLAGLRGALESTPG